jgi:hypothetical protein
VDGSTLNAGELPMMITMLPSQVLVRWSKCGISTMSSSSAVLTSWAIYPSCCKLEVIIAGSETQINQPGTNSFLLSLFEPSSEYKRFLYRFTSGNTIYKDKTTTNEDEAELPPTCMTLMHRTLVKQSALFIGQPEPGHTKRRTSAERCPGKTCKFRWIVLTF